MWTVVVYVSYSSFVFNIFSFFLLFFPRQGSLLYSPEYFTCSVHWVTLNSQRSTCFCQPSPEIKVLNKQARVGSIFLRKILDIRSHNHLNKSIIETYELSYFSHRVSHYDLKDQLLSCSKFKNKK